MNPLLLGLLVLVVAVVAVKALGERARDRRLKALRADWGRPRPPASHDADDPADESWRLLDSGSVGPLGLDDRTWVDLHLDDVLATIDRTRTGLGRQQLHRRLRTGTSLGESPGLLALTDRFTESAPLRDAVGLRLEGCGRGLGRGFWIITREDAIRTRWWYAMYPVLSLSMIAAIVLTVLEPRFLLAIGALAAVNMAARMATAWQIPGILAPIRQLGPLLKGADSIVAVPEFPAEARPGIAEALDHLRRLRTIAAWVGRDPMTAGELASSIYEYLNLFFLLDGNALFFGARHLRRHRDELARVACWLGDVDLARMRAALQAESNGWCRPTWDDGAETVGRGLWHPLVAAPVANDVELTPGSGLVITGANMTGKSTYLRTVGLAAALAAALELCPARAWHGRRFAVRSLIGRADDLHTGRSYYLVEAERVVELLGLADLATPTLFLLDELLRGTNTIERLAAGEAILRRLVQGGGNVALVATHDGELVGMLADRYQSWHFAETIVGGELRFEYRREAGPARTRTALALLAAAGAPVDVVSAARQRASELDRSQAP